MAKVATKRKAKAPTTVQDDLTAVMGDLLDEISSLQLAHHVLDSLENTYPVSEFPVGADLSALRVQLGRSLKGLDQIHNRIDLLNARGY